MPGPSGQPAGAHLLRREPSPQGLLSRALSLAWCPPAVLALEASLLMDPQCAGSRGRGSSQTRGEHNYAFAIVSEPRHLHGVRARSRPQRTLSHTSSEETCPARGALRWAWLPEAPRALSTSCLGRARVRAGKSTEAARQGCGFRSRERGHPVGSLTHPSTLQRYKGHHTVFGDPRRRVRRPFGSDVPCSQGGAGPLHRHAHPLCQAGVSCG